MCADAITCLAFSTDARWLISGTGSGDLKVWDTAGWSMAQALKGCRKEEPTCVVASPCQTWLVSVQPSALHVFQLAPPFALEQAIPSMVCPSSKEASQWCCGAFAPGKEVDHQQGQPGESNHFVALSSTHLCVFDYSGGWNPQTPRRTHSILRYARPTGVSYTLCKAWILIVYDNGQMQIWNADSLTLFRKLTVHEGPVWCMALSPQRAKYACRLATVSQDRRIRVWHSGDWHLEEERREKSCSDLGIIRCSFSTSGIWFLTISRVFCIWRVCLNNQGRIYLCIHQKVDTIGSVDGLGAAAFSSSKNAIAAGSIDGALGVYQRFPGLPTDYPYEDDGDDSDEEEEQVPVPGNSSVEGEAWTTACDEPRLRPRPMRRVSMELSADAEGIKKAYASIVGNGPEGWLQKWQLRSTTTAVPHPLLGRRNSGSAPGFYNNGASTDKVAPSNSGPRGVINKSRSSSDLKRWTCRHFDAVFNAQVANSHHVMDQGLAKPPILK